MCNSNKKNNNVSMAFWLCYFNCGFIMCLLLNNKLGAKSQRLESHLRSTADPETPEDFLKCKHINLFFSNWLNQALARH